MKYLPTFVLFIGIGLVIPIIYFFIFRRRSLLDKIPVWVWSVTGINAFLFFPAFLFRKHWEKALVLAYNKFWFVLTIVQMDNNFWETLAKLLVIIIFIALTKDNGKDTFKQKRTATIFGYWVGLCYGIGEAITLSVIGYFPLLNRIFGINLFMYFTTWYTIWERFYAIQLHAIIGALVGLGFYHWYGLAKRWWLLLFFIFGMLYHELVDGLVIVMMYFPRLEFIKFLRIHIYTITLPVLLIIGYFILLIVYKVSKNIRQESKGG
ncbi:MAG: hypothetical protein N2201_06365 [candidate division WOR-3 bacterium]|nr:hypothetical protein [candidate division WOR-3 bacterium]